MRSLLVVALLASPAVADRCKTLPPDRADETIPTPVAMCGVANAKHVKAGFVYTLVELADGSTRRYGGEGWSDNGRVLDKDDLVPYQRPPEGRPTIPGATQIAGDGVDGCAIAKGGQLWCWGDLAEDSGDVLRPKAKLIAKLANVVDVSASHHVACVALRDGTARCWGESFDGEKAIDPPRSVPGTDLVAIGASSSSEFQCALRRSGQVLCRGDNAHGELGDGTHTSHKDWRPVVGVTDATQLSVGEGHACVLTKTHTVMCWGDNPFGEIGLPRRHFE
ncbi:MAG TPA: hypothetical protein VGM88_13015 [Kofleriaceae bacterium]|jgi:alpha-tubulin suppressor-like RCC1 family protein